METKKCRQCGEIKPIEQFRPYYSGSGTYTICKTCEKINSRAKYLHKKGDSASESDRAELAKIEQLYELQRACGLRPPARASKMQDAMDELDKLLSHYQEKAASKSDIPSELQHWLEVELTDVPEYYLDDIYESLKAKYRPVVRVDDTTLLPIYDETHADTLEQILERFNDYEDEYYQ